MTGEGRNIMNHTIQALLEGRARVYVMTVPTDVMEVLLPLFCSNVSLL